MSRSYSLPKWPQVKQKKDRKLANRGVRARVRAWLYAMDFDAVPFPHRLECSHNERYGWNIDGGKILVTENCRYPSSEQIVLLSRK